MKRSFAILAAVCAISLPASAETVKIEISEQGFQPSEIHLKVGEPAHLVFTRTTDTTCATEVQVPGLQKGMKKIPLNKPTSIDFTPTKVGKYGFACGMNMVKGVLIVQ
jgi:Cu(I)/Ag(I) efflux system membrane fusion protein